MKRQRFATLSYLVFSLHCYNAEDLVYYERLKKDLANNLHALYLHQVAFSFTHPENLCQQTILQLI